MGFARRFRPKRNSGQDDDVISVPRSEVEDFGTHLLRGNFVAPQQVRSEALNFGTRDGNHVVILTGVSLGAKAAGEAH